MVERLNILFPSKIYPEESGEPLRTFNLAKLAHSYFDEVNIFAKVENDLYKGNISGINIYQEKKYEDIFDKYDYYLKRLFYKKYALKVSEKAFKNDSLIQLESPYFYHTIRSKGIDDYVLDQHNVYWELKKFSQDSFFYKIIEKSTYKRDKKIEKDAINNATQIIVCSERDKKIMIDEVPPCKNKISIIPNCIDYEKYDLFLKNNTKIANINKKTVLFVGLLSYQPNRDAVDLICKKIAPKLDDDFVIKIIGRNPPSITPPKNVKFLGYVDNLNQQLLDADICISPLRFGSGTRLKILSYLAMKKPVISTTKGAEGLDYVNGKNIIIEDNIDNYHNRILNLIEDEKMMKRLGNQGERLVKEKYDWKIYSEKLKKIYETVVK
jgi:glycosyltransferase involved in cell wall biosynthesis